MKLAIRHLVRFLLLVSELADDVNISNIMFFLLLWNTGC